MNLIKLKYTKQIKQACHQISSLMFDGYIPNINIRYLSRIIKQSAGSDGLLKTVGDLWYKLTSLSSPKSNLNSYFKIVKKLREITPKELKFEIEELYGQGKALDQIEEKLRIFYETKDLIKQLKDTKDASNWEQTYNHYNNLQSNNPRYKLPFEYIIQQFKKWIDLNIDLSSILLTSNIPEIRDYVKEKLMKNANLQRRLKQTIKTVRLAQRALKHAQQLGSYSSEVVDLLQKALRGEYQQWDLYYAYKDELSGLSRDNISEHFKEHAADEEDHISLLQRYLVSAGIKPTKKRELIPEISGSTKDYIALQLKFELSAVETYQQILQLLKDIDPLKIDIENILTKETEHVHDLERFFEDKVQDKGQIYE